jgi:hypothetical protein
LYVVTQYQGYSDGCAIEDAGSLLCTVYHAGSKVLRIDPDTGSWSTVTSGGNLVVPTGIVLDDLGDIYLTDSLSGGGDGPTGQIIHVDHVLGTQTVVSSGGLLSGELRELVFDAEILSNLVERLLTLLPRAAPWRPSGPRCRSFGEPVVDRAECGPPHRSSSRASRCAWPVAPISV